MSQSGWYPDPSDGNQQRYWDGTNWTEHRAPAQAAQYTQAGQAGRAPAGQPATVPYGTGPAAAYPGVYSGASSSVNGKAITALVLGILGLVLCGLFTGIPAMVLGRSAVKEIDAAGGQQEGRSLATAGFWTGLVSTLLWVLGLVFVVVIFVVAATSDNGSTSTCIIHGSGATTCH